MEFWKEKYWKVILKHIINNEVAFYYQFEGGHMDEADTLETVAQWDSMSTLDQKVPGSKTSDVLGQALKHNLVTGLPVTFGTSCEWDFLVISGRWLWGGQTTD